VEFDHRFFGAEFLHMMTPTSVLTIVENALEVGALVSAPMLLAALATGLVVSLFQAATQINEMTLSFIPKLLVLVGVLIIGGPWMLGVMMDYMERLFTGIPAMIG
jgi:flagellar biosynthetic protein FliQ